MAHTDNVIRFWDLDNDGADDSGIGSTLTNNNSVTFDGTRASFNGTNQTLVSEHLTALDGATTATFVAWIKRGSGETVGLGRASAGSACFSLLWYTNDTLYVEVGDGSAAAYGRCDLSGTAEHHIAVVFDGGQTGDANRLKIYIDGSLAIRTFDSGVAVPAALQTNSTGWTFGNDISGRFTGGQIRGAAIYSSANDATWVTADYNSGTLKKWADWNPGGTNFPITASLATFTLTGQSASLRAARKLVSAKATYTATGIAAGLRFARRLIAAKSTITFSAISASLRFAHNLHSSKGTFTFSGIAANIDKGRSLTAAKATFTFSALAAALRGARKIPSSRAQFTLTGKSARLAHCYSLTALRYQASLTGISSLLRIARRLTSARSAFTLSGLASTLTYATINTVSTKAELAISDVAATLIAISDRS